ncbi:MAG: hypothetical protein VW405_06230 [Rhodospirillaceae bacterium]
MLVPVTYTGPKESLHLSWTTDGLDFTPGQATLVPEALIPLLKELPGHGFQFPAPATQAGAEVLEPAAEAPADEPAPAPAKKPGRKPKEA